MAKIDKLLTAAQDHLDPGEQVIATVLGAYETKILGKNSVRNGIFIATNKRLVFYAKKLMGYDLETFPYSTLSSIEMSKGMMGHSISFFASGNKVSMKWINGGDITKFIEYVRGNIGKKEEVKTESVDVADQISKLASLKDAGVLTEDEFTAKKKQLLNI